MKKIKEKIKEIFNFKKIKESILNHKRISIGVLAAILVVVIGITLGNTIFNSEKTKLTKYLTELGRDYYENFYYDQIGSDDNSKKEFVAKYADVGFKIDLDNLSRFNIDANKSKIEAFKMDDSSGCNKNNTKVTIKPYEPYDKTSYNIEITLDCANIK